MWIKGIFIGVCYWSNVIWEMGWRTEGLEGVKRSFIWDGRDGSEGRGREISISFIGMNLRKFVFGGFNFFCKVGVLVIF